ncbi:b483f333-68c1-4f86-990c-cfb483ee93d8-CDS [Sclerotinia trifoliorum]|uniref:B483f333-68c1-4f86-990c-cfb483ee93d8-CDS n=1 Tax=Sclerotinia trifoliorum TaxID=28548 RepID=A0A8H2W410_9HELO|nr:b483f333-68c1-4f86-990c-cfb483ee93d8-CDS [Sclerotinia trifoliorum]
MLERSLSRMPGTIDSLGYILDSTTPFFPPVRSTKRSLFFSKAYFQHERHGVEVSSFQPRESVAVFGAGPVGLMAVYSVEVRGAGNLLWWIA